MYLKTLQIVSSLRRLRSILDVRLRTFFTVLIDFDLCSSKKICLKHKLKIGFLQKLIITKVWLIKIGFQSYEYVHGYIFAKK
jgi:hypothetical protein